MAKTVREDKPRSFTEYQGKNVASFKCSEGATKVEYTPEYVQYDTSSEAREAGKWPNDDTILSMLNQRIKTAGVASAYQAAVAPYKAEFDNSPAKLRKDFIDSALAGGKVTQEQAEALADSLGFTE